MGISTFGKLLDGTDIQEIRLEGGALSVAILTRGCAIRALDFDAGRGPQGRVLGFNTLGPYLGPSPYFGCVAGRYANRIAGGRFMLDGHAYQLTRNERERTHLHGGRTGFSHRAWRVLDHGTDHVTLELVSPAGEEGYPGTMTVRCTYRISGNGVLQIDLTATTDAPTVINLATHSYFNLDGTPDILAHRLEIAAEHYTPVDATLIPTGEIARHTVRFPHGAAGGWPWRHLRSQFRRRPRTCRDTPIDGAAGRAGEPHAAGDPLDRTRCAAL